MSRDISKRSSEEFNVQEELTVGSFKKVMYSKYPELSTIKSFSIAVNENYAQDDCLIKHNDILAIIPPVSGG